MNFFNKRLLKLAKHLETGKREHDHFDFRVIHQLRHISTSGRDCGSYGCAMGELPRAFPRKWRWNNGGNIPLLRFITRGHPITDVCNFFNLTQRETKRLFCPLSHHCPLGAKATRQKVAANRRCPRYCFRARRADQYSGAQCLDSGLHGRRSRSRLRGGGGRSAKTG